MTTHTDTVGNVLLIEDNRGDADLVTAMLEGDGDSPYRLVHVPTVADAIAAMATTRFDVVLTDLRLPDDTGAQVVRRLRATDANIPIVILTGSEDPDMPMTCVAAGAHDYLEKSEIRPRTLHRAIGYARSLAREIELQTLRRTIEGYRAISTAAQPTTITATLAQSGAVQLRAPAIFDAIVADYFALLSNQLLRPDTLDDSSGPTMTSIVTRLGDAGAGPRDLLDAHLAALDRLTTAAPSTRVGALLIEGRLVALRMMGLLVDYYRVGQRSRTARRPE